MKSTLRSAIPLLALCPLLSVAAPRAAVAQGGVSWQQSQAPSVTLGVRDKYGALGSYTARFVITDAAGHRAQKSVAVHADAFGFVTYPDGIRTFPSDWMYSGTYSWVCLVRGHVAARGKFSLTDTQNGQQVRTMDAF